MFYTSVYRHETRSPARPRPPRRGPRSLAYSGLRPKALTLTGIVTTNDVVVSPQVAGLVGELLVTEGDLVKKGQLLATITPDELRADTAYYAQNAQGSPPRCANRRRRSGWRRASRPTRPPRP